MRSRALTAVLALVAAGCGRATLGASGVGPSGCEACASLPHATAVASLDPRSGSRMTGHTQFFEYNGRVNLSVSVQNAAPGVYGVYLHQRPDCTAPDAMSAGPVFEPTANLRGGSRVAPQREGYLGDVTVGAEGHGNLSLTFTICDLTVAPGLTSVVGRSIVLQASRDDPAGGPTGYSGPRVACGVLQVYHEPQPTGSSPREG